MSESFNLPPLDLSAAPAPLDLPSLDEGPARTYEEFVASKVPIAKRYGIADPPPVSDFLFPFQRDCVRWALQVGRAALYENCGLGKGPQALDWARVVAGYTGGQVLIFAPLAVAQQFLREAQKFGIAGVAYARDQSEATTPITVTNYERLDGFDAPRFAGVALDESGCLKNYMGSTKRQLVEAFAKTRFKLCCSATPAPNDHLELGNQSEFLGVLPSHDMIARWFINDTSLFGNYHLKGHAVVPFWDWVSSWARCVDKPSDLGYSDEGYVLPPLRVYRHVIEVDSIKDRGENLFRIPELSATSIHAEKRRTVGDRARKVAELVAAEPREPWIIWCETDYEADALIAVIPEAVDVRGSDSLERKEASLVDFCVGRKRVLLTKARIAGFGLNLQHCARVAYVGATFSWEAFYQTTRRCWRFGQKRPVDVHVVMAHTELAVWDVLLRKQIDHDAMKVEMFAATRRAQAKTDDRRRDYHPTKALRLPSFLE